MFDAFNYNKKRKKKKTPFLLSGGLFVFSRGKIEAILIYYCKTSFLTNFFLAFHWSLITPPLFPFKNKVALFLFVENTIFSNCSFPTPASFIISPIVMPSPPVLYEILRFAQDLRSVEFFNSLKLTLSTIYPKFFSLEKFSSFLLLIII